MKKVIHIKTLMFAGMVATTMLLAFPAFAEEDPSVTYSTMYIPGVTDYNVDGDVTLDVNVAEINALEITLSTSNLAIDLTPKIGIPSFDTDTLDILVGTTNITGYTLTMASSYNGNSTTSLTRTESISSTVPTIDTIGSTVTPTDFASTSDTSSINKWGYLLSATNLDVNKTVYNPVLSSNTVNSSTEAVYNDPTTITFGAKVDSDLPAGNYRATLKFMAVSNINTYSIMYNAGSASSDSTLTNMPSPNPQTGALEGGGSTTIVLSSASPSRTGYSFINWCSVSPTTSNNTDSCNGTTYSAGGNMEINNSEPDVNLYAMWGVDTYAVNITNSNTTSSASSIYVPYGGSATVTVTPSSDYYLSQVSCPSGYTCTGYNTGTSYTGQQTVTITNNNYAGGGTVGFEGTESGYSYNLTFNGNGGTASQTSLSGTGTTITLPTATYKNSYATFAGWSESATATTATWTNSMTISSATTKTLYAVWSYNSGTMQNTSTSCGTNMVDARTGVSYLTYTISGNCYMEQNLYLPTGLTLRPSDSNVTREWTTPSSSTMPSNSYDTPYMVTGTHANNTYNATGGWYNYCAASAGTVCSQTQADAAQDVCPKGWKLPTNAQMSNVISANRSNWKFYAGRYYNGYLQSASTISYWWSATAYSATVQYLLYYGNGSLNTSIYDVKNLGYFVRCVRI